MLRRIGCTSAVPRMGPRCWLNRRTLATAAVINKIDRVLIANRGEIALRVMRTARRLGVETVAVFSDADRGALHTRLADCAFHIGPAPSLHSYLNMDTVIETALRSRAQAIHPGYGFLSENAEFADKCASAGLVFMGPPSQAIRDMGAKSVAKRIMSSAGVPVVQGYHGSEQSDETLRNEAIKIGYPVMLKAVYGGGGKGMRVAMNDTEFAEKLESARSEARKAFGNDEMIVEKFVERPRHVEVQIFGDRHGNCVYLWERDCSVQRRHQKIIEEAPAPGVSDATRRGLGESAVRAARAVNYVGAGTVEFILGPTGEYFFMEMNTRLQVEHPVTEAITGLDLVEWQFRVAEGQPLPLKQEDVPLKGHALEARIYAEDTTAGFMPMAGTLKHLRFPAWARVDTGVEEGDQVSVHYDPMIAKVIVWSDDRKKAVGRLERALQETHIAGLPTNVSFMRAVLTHPQFVKGNVYTEFIRDHEKELFATGEATQWNLCKAIVARHLLSLGDSVVGDPFKANDYFRLNHHASVSIELNGKSHRVELLPEGTLRVSLSEDDVMEVTVEDVQRSGHEVRFGMVYNGEKRRVKAVNVEGKLTVFGKEHREYTVHAESYAENVADEMGKLDAVAPMPGVVDKILVKAGDVVKHGQALVVIVAMKMEYIVRAPTDAVVESVLCGVGASVAKHAHLVKFEHSEDS